MRLLVLLTLFVTSLSLSAAAAEVRIGVLSYRGGESALRTWAATADYLQAEMPDVRFRLKPLTLDALTQAAAEGGVDFVITNPGHSFQLVRRTGASRVASARSTATENQTQALGSAVITRADSSIRTLRDLDGQRLAIVAQDAFGGHLIARYAILKQAERDPSAPRPNLEVEVVGFPHQAVLKAVLNGEAAAGVVRACLIESLEAAGQLDPAALRVIAPRQPAGFACRTSTPLYPDWAFLRLPHVSADLATTVTRALLSMPRAAGGDPWLGHDGWIAPVSYAAVEAVYRDLGLYPYGQELPDALRRWVRDNLAWVALGAVLLGLFLLHVGRVEILVRRRTRELEAAAQRSRILQGELAHAERVSSLNILAGSLAHDLNQPLAAISTYAAGLLLRQERGTADPAAIEGTLRRISEQANRASAFIRSMRAFLTKQPAQREVLDLRDLVDEVVVLLSTYAAKHNCRLLSIRPAVPIPVFGDDVQLRQVTMALVQNAIDAMEGPGADGGEVEISLQRDAEVSILTVSDRGCGLSDEALERALEPFFSTKGGLGLGLATAATIVDHHNGRLTLEPRPGGGTVACVSLPLPKRNPGEQEQA
ncbi:MAG: hypothetical protein VR70_12650 [Rhodospirillaceae bacterium BRH_c57]|nr:MAG: hypothetical protein VR70_12650 [Rhodospirillaceae bacterium BRH_c57]